jgi:hypothetical protein
MSHNEDTFYMKLHLNKLDKAHSLTTRSQNTKGQYH